MQQIFQFDQLEVCCALIQHINAELGHKFNSEDLSDVLLKVVLPDGCSEWLDGRIQLIMGQESEV
jgi:hypothetical protein